MSSLCSQSVPFVSDNFAYIIPVDEIEHSPLYPFCYDQTCSCHEDDEAIGASNSYSVVLLNGGTEFKQQ